MTMVQWINPERTLLVRYWPDDEASTPPRELEVVARLDSDAIWGPPITVTLEA
jgi:hypothetical protein